MRTRTGLTLELLLGCTLYAAGIWAFNYAQSTSSSPQLALVLLPGVPIVYIASVVMRRLLQLDELQRKIITEAMAFAGVVTGLFCFNYLFLRDLGAREFKSEWAFYLLLLFYAIGMVWSKKRYQ